MEKHKAMAIAGTVLMGLGAYWACLGSSDMMMAAGNGILMLSILVMIYGYRVWQP